MRLFSLELIDLRNQSNKKFTWSWVIIYIIIISVYFKIQWIISFDLSKYSWDCGNFSYFESVTLVLKSINNFPYYFKSIQVCQNLPEKLSVLIVLLCLF